MVAMMVTGQGLCQILNIRQLIGRRSLRKIFRELSQLTGRRGIALRSCCLRGRLQIGSDLLGYCLVFGWVRLLQLL